MQYPPPRTSAAGDGLRATRQLYAAAWRGPSTVRSAQAQGPTPCRARRTPAHPLNKHTQVQRNIPVAGDYVLSLSWDPEGQYLAACMRITGALVVYDAKTGQADKRLEGVMEQVRYGACTLAAVLWAMGPQEGTMPQLPGSRDRAPQRCSQGCYLHHHPDHPGGAAGPP